MCGIAGFINTSNFLNTESVLRKMIDSLKHRGPDSEGGWTNESSSVAFIHTRLAIQDLSEAGKQPMQSTSGRYVITYNGEIYNSTQLRKKLEQADYHFRGHSDTEVILAAIEEYGLETAIAKFIGMFAFALWDKKTEQLSLVRDRLGIKPLYYGWHNNAFVFGSEIKALCAIPGFKQDINRHALASYLRFNYIPTPYSIYTNIHKLKPGNILTIKYDDIHRKELKERQYWSVHEHYIEDPTITPQIAVEQTEKLLKDAIALRMLSDVPLGAFLSGGVDSSLVVALMQAQSNVPVKTFSIGFTEKGFNEATYAKEIAQHLGTNHTELYL
ncbi:MAG: asparagine synthase (glutamine-hydrolyzing), partial [Gammaproteobacteria bacterium]|nr:asparagine synthase (glutamine-hydrolyzing) [Gammaproteobacteria bacterium]